MKSEKEIELEKKIDELNVELMCARTKRYKEQGLDKSIYWEAEVTVKLRQQYISISELHEELRSETYLMDVDLPDMTTQEKLDHLVKNADTYTEVEDFLPFLKDNIKEIGDVKVRIIRDESPSNEKAIRVRKYLELLEDCKNKLINITQLSDLENVRDDLITYLKLRGIEKDAHLGKQQEIQKQRGLTKDLMKLEWFLGQLLSIMEEESYFALNSWVNNIPNIKDTINENQM